MSEEKLNTKKWLYNFKVPRKYNKKIEEEYTIELAPA